MDNDKIHWIEGKKAIHAPKPRKARFLSDEAQIFAALIVAGLGTWFILAPLVQMFLFGVYNMLTGKHV